MYQYTKKQSKKILAIILAGFTAITLSVNSVPFLKGSTNSSQVVKAATEATSEVLYGQVQSISGSKVTLALGTLNVPDNSSTNKTLPTGAPTPKAMPSGTPPNDAKLTPGAMPSGGPAPSMITLSGDKKVIEVTDTTLLAKIKAGDILKLTYTVSGSKSTLSQIELVTGPGQGGKGNGGQPGSSSSGKPTITGTAKLTVSGKTVTKSSVTYTATVDNQSGVRATKSSKLTLKKITIKTSGNTTSTEESDFYGLNAGIIAENNSTVNISDSSITTTGEGGNAVFAYGNGSSIKITNSKIVTTDNSSRGLDATYGGKITADNITISTKGTHSAAIATDRGEGTITANKLTATTAGVDSPGIYSTGKITVKNSTIKATGSEAAVVEGKNSINLSNTSLSGAKKRGVMLYQSTSGDAAEGTASFTMTKGSLTSTTGPLFYITNTSAVIKLTNVTLKNSSKVLLAAGADGWGKTRSNGGAVTLTAKSQTLSGAVTADKISSVTINLTAKSTLNAAINKANTAKYMKITLDTTSTWQVTDNSYLTVITDKDNTLANIDDNGHNIYYDSSNSANSWLKGKTITLKDGGKLIPIL